MYLTEQEDLKQIDREEITMITTAREYNHQWKRMAEQNNIGGENQETG